MADKKELAVETTGTITVTKLGVNHYRIEVLGIPTDKAPLSATGKTRKIAHNGFGQRLPDGNTFHISVLCPVNHTTGTSTKTTLEGF